MGNNYKNFPKCSLTMQILLHHHTLKESEFQRRALESASQIILMHIKILNRHWFQLLYVFIFKRY